VITTKQYRKLFREVAAVHGLAPTGTWTDDVYGRGGPMPGDPRRTVTFEVISQDREIFAPLIIEPFLEDLKDTIKEFELLNPVSQHQMHNRYIPNHIDTYLTIRHTSLYIKATAYMLTKIR